MPSHIALLRAVNVAGTSRIAMAELRAWMAELGFADAQTLLQSGNIVFDGGRVAGARLEQRLEREAVERLALHTEFFVRTAGEWRDLVTANPFRAEARRDPARLVALVLRKAPSAGAVRALQDAITGREVVRATGRVAYVVYPDGQGRSRLTSAVLERALGSRGTARNWNTVLKLAALVGA